MNETLTVIQISLSIYTLDFFFFTFALFWFSLFGFSTSFSSMTIFHCDVFLIFTVISICDPLSKSESGLEICLSQIDGMRLYTNVHVHTLRE